MPPAKLDPIFCAVCQTPNRMTCRVPDCSGCHEASLAYRSLLHQERCAKFIAAGKCVNCREPNSNGKRNCDVCLTKVGERNKELRGKGLCVQCGKESGSKSLCRECSKKVSKSTKQLASVYKRAIYSAYGGYRCACCGVDKEDCLAIDHIYNDGSEDRSGQREGAKGGAYASLIKRGFPGGFQVLCYNCNVRKARLGVFVLPREDGLTYLPCCSAVPAGGTRYKQTKLTSNRRRFPNTTERTFAVLSASLLAKEPLSSNVAVADLDRLEMNVNKTAASRVKRKWLYAETKQADNLNLGS